MGRRSDWRRKFSDEISAAAAVLRGGYQASFEELIDLIHRINPTGLRLPREQSVVRYQTKSQLQSVLIRRFPEELLIRPLPDAPGTVLLDLRGSQRNACHAVLEYLDEDTRSHVQLTLDQLRSRPPAPVTATAPRSRRRAVEAPPPAAAEPSRAPRARRPLSSNHPSLSAVARHLLRGRRAQEAYDFDAAERHLRRAFALSGGAVEPTRALLLLLVDHLAADDQALALMPEIQPEARGRVEVRLHLALAAARCGEEAIALAEVRGLTPLRHSQAAEVLLLLARRALASERLDEALFLRAEERLREAREHDPAHSEVQAVQAELERKRALAAAPLEAEILRCLDHDDLDAAEPLVRRLLQRWPESETGRRALRVITELKAEAEAAAQVARAECLVQEGRGAAAIALLQQATQTLQHAGADAALRERIHAHLEALQQAQRERQFAARLEEVVRALRDPASRGRGLQLHGALRPAQRAAVRARLSEADAGVLELLDWLDITETVRHETLRSRCDAVLALHRARQVLPDDPEEVLALLQTHGRLLEGVPLTTSLHREAERAIWQRQHDHALRVFHQAEAARRGGHLEQAVQQLSAVNLHTLGPEAQASYAQWQRQLQEERERQHLIGMFQQLLDSGAHFQARDVAESLLRRAQDADEEARWQGGLEEIDGALQRRFCVQSSEGPGVAQELCDVDPSPNRGSGAGAWLLPEEDALLWAASQGPYVFLQELALPPYDPAAEAAPLAEAAPAATTPPVPSTSKVHTRPPRAADVDRSAPLPGGALTVRRRLFLRTPEPLLLHSWQVDRHGVISLVGEGGALLQLHRHQGQYKVLRFLSGSDLPAGRATARICGVHIDPEGRHLWVLGRQGWRWDMHTLTSRRNAVHGRVVDVTRGQARDVGEHGWACPVPGLPEGGEPVMLAPRRPEVVGVYSARGACLGEISAPGTRFAEAGQRHPSGRGYLLLTAADEGHRFGGRTKVRLVSVSEQHQVQHIEALPDEVFTSYGPEHMVTVPGVAVQRLRWQHSSALLAAWGAAEDGGLDLRYASPVPLRSVLTRDGLSQRAGLLYCDAEEARYVPVSAQGFTFRRLPSAAYHDSDDPLEILSCSSTGRPVTPGVQEIRRRLIRLGHDDRRLMLLLLANQLRDDPTHMLALYDAVHYPTELQGLSDELTRQMAALQPADPHVRLVRAGDAFRSGGYLEVLRLLAAPPEAGLPDELARHWHHLLGAALIVVGERQAALIVLRKARGHAGRCSVLPLMSLCWALKDDYVRGDEWPHTSSACWQLRLAITRADLALEEADLDRARAQIDRRVVWTCNEIQSQARLAEVYLLWQPRGDAERFRKQLALATFLATLASERQLPFLEQAFSADRLAQLRGLCERWLAASADPQRRDEPPLLLTQRPPLDLQRSGPTYKVDWQREAELHQTLKALSDRLTSAEDRAIFDCLVS